MQLSTMLLALPVSLVTFACSSADDADDIESRRASLSASCEVYARAVIGKSAECPVELGDLDDSDAAVHNLVRVCESLFGAPGSDDAGSKMQACANAIAASSCLDFHGGALAECAALGRGTLAVGDDCYFDNQCASGVCNGLSSSSCGTCRARAKAGEACGTSSTNVPCEDGLVCLAISSTEGTCEAVDVAPSREGAACEYASDCGNAWLACIDNKCTQRGDVCQSIYHAPSDCKAGQTCDIKKNKDLGRCVDADLGYAGEACNSGGWRDVEKNQYPCSPDLYCATSGTYGTCRTRVAEGGSCSPSILCANGLQCIDGV